MKYSKSFSSSLFSSGQYSRYGNLHYLLFLILFVLSSATYAQHDPELLRQNAEVSVERLLMSKGDEAISNFIEQHMVQMTADEKKEVITDLRKLRDNVRPAMGDVGVGFEDFGVVFFLSSEDEQKEVNVYINDDKGKIERIELAQKKGQFVLTEENVKDVVKDLENSGFAGLIYVKKNDKTIIKEGFGLANKERNIPVSQKTIFGIGSRPIDFTKAAIYLLDQRKVISISDPITKHFENVPDDKKSMTIEHLMTGQSGYPDFFDIKTDWDPDLHYIDRPTAVKRLLNQELLFAPGTERRHSHGAFGLLAALVEIKTEGTYYEFIRKNFLHPAQMTRTGEYGEVREGLQLEDFAVGGGPQFMGLPNIPPNWGKTSWLVKGSGGMYSTLDDLLKFYDYCRSGKVLDQKHQTYFRSPTANLDGSMRGFELFNYYHPSKGEAYLFINNIPDRDQLRPIFRALERMVEQQ